MGGRRSGKIILLLGGSLEGAEDVVPLYDVRCRRRGAHEEPTKRPAPRALPADTMAMFWQMSETEMFAPERYPMGRKNMLATECSRPKATKVQMGNQRARILPGFFFCGGGLVDMAVATSQLAPMENKKRQGVVWQWSCHRLLSLDCIFWAPPYLPKDLLCLTFSNIHTPL